MKNLIVIQHTDAEFLGLIEDHLEGRNIRFRYLRPPVDSAWLLKAKNPADGLILMGGGPWGTAGEQVLPILEQEQKLAKEYLDKGLPVIGIGVGAQVLALAAGGATEASPLEFSVGAARRVEAGALNGFLPAMYPLVIYMRDRPLPPADARILAVDAVGRPALFQIGENSLGFSGHPGTKGGIIEDLLMEFVAAPADPAPTLDVLRAMQSDIAMALNEMMVGIVQITGWMKDE